MRINIATIIKNNKIKTLPLKKRALISLVFY